MLNCFKNTPGGIPGDDDSGAMSAWYVFMALGIYPEIPGIGGVTMLSPLFPDATMHLPNGKTITMKASHASRDAKYIQSMQINDKASSKLWLTVDELQKGVALKYVMADVPSTTWGASITDAPPSFEPNVTRT